MVTLSPKLPPLPNPAVPPVDPKTGLITADWYSWLKLLDTVTRTLRDEVSSGGGGSYQPLDADLTTIAGLTATTDSFMQAKSSAWAARTIAQVKTDLSLSGSNTGDQTTVSGNAGTATALQTARTIGGVSFNGTANITVASATGGFTSTNYAMTGSAASLITFDCSTSTVVIANGSNTAIAGSIGMLLLTDQTVLGDTGLYLSNGSAAVLIGTTGTEWVASTTTPAAGKASIALSGGVLRIYNNAGGSMTAGVCFIRTR